MRDDLDRIAKTGLNSEDVFVEDYVPDRGRESVNSSSVQITMFTGSGTDHKDDHNVH